jgi:hypothetical protein
MGADRDVVVLADDGRWWQGTAEVEVTESACMDAA